MRYYTIKIINDDGSIHKTYSSLRPGSSASQYGSTLPGALNIEFDLTMSLFATPTGSPWVRIWGVSLTEISQANNINGKRIQVYGGMAAGYPLAKPDQGGLLAEGSIIQAFGNWMGTSQTLEILFYASVGTPKNAMNIIVDGAKGTKLSTVLHATIANAFPAYKAKISIGDDLVLTNDEKAFFGSVGQLAIYIKALSQSLNRKTGYRGVDIQLTQDTFLAFDAPDKTNPKEIKFTDLIGQPTWLSPLQIQITCVLRADLQLGQYVTLPKGLTTTTQQSYSQYRQASVFNGSFLVQGIRHVGNYRSPDGTTWVTVIDLSSEGVS